MCKLVVVLGHKFPSLLLNQWRSRQVHPKDCGSHNGSSRQSFSGDTTNLDRFPRQAEFTVPLQCTCQTFTSTGCTGKIYVRAGAASRELLPQLPADQSAARGSPVRVTAQTVVASMPCLQGRKDCLPLHPTRCYQRHITAGDGRGRSRCPTVLFAHHGLNAGHPGEVVNPTE